MSQQQQQAPMVTHMPICDAHSEALRVHEHRIDSLEVSISSIAKDIKDGHKEIIGRLDRVMALEINHAHMKEAQERAFKAIGAFDARLMQVENSARDIGDIKSKVSSVVKTVDAFAVDQHRIEGMLTTIKWIGYGLAGVISIATAIVQTVK